MESKLKIKNRIFLLVLILISLTSFEKVLAQTTHVYALGEYFYFKIVDSDSYELKIGMYGEDRMYGDYEIHNDTLVLTSFKFKLKYNKNNKELIKDRFGKSLIKDSLVIPFYFSNIELKKVHRIKRDSNLIDKYLMSDGHVVYTMNLHEDSIFNYYTGSDISRYKIHGKWTRKGDTIFFHPESEKHLDVFGWICSDNKMVIMDKFLIGKVTGESEYMYMFNR